MTACRLVLGCAWQPVGAALGHNSCLKVQPVKTVHLNCLLRGSCVCRSDQRPTKALPQNFKGIPSHTLPYSILSAV